MQRLAARKKTSTTPRTPTSLGKPPKLVALFFNSLVHVFLHSNDGRVGHLQLRKLIWLEVRGLMHFGRNFVHAG